MATVRMDAARDALGRLIEQARAGSDDRRVAAAREMLLQTWLLIGEQDAALAQLDRWIEQDPDDTWARDRRLELLGQMQRTEPLREALQAELERTDDDRRSDLISLATRAGLVDLAEQALRGWLEDASPMQRRRWTSMLVDLLVQSGRAPEAIKLAESYQGGFEDGILRRLWLARARVVAGQIDDGLSEFDALMRDRLVPPELRPTVWDQSVSVLIDGKHDDRAIQRCRAWLDAHRDDPAARQAAWSRIVRIRIEQGRFDDAVEAARAWLDEVETAEPKYRYPALRTWAAALQAAGQERAYAAALAEARYYQPDDPGIANDLGYTWIDHGQHPDKAGELIRRAVAAEPLNAAFIDSLGWYHYRTGRFERAFAELSRAVRFVEGRDPVVYDHLADCAWRLGRRDEARQAWQTALELIETQGRDDPVRQRAWAPLRRRIRDKLEALSARRQPAVAPTLEEQHGTQAASVRD